MMFSEWMIQYRQEHKVSQRSMADTLSTSPMTINRIEHGLRFKPTEQMAFGLIRFGVQEQILAIDDDRFDFNTLKAIIKKVTFGVNSETSVRDWNMESIVGVLSDRLAEIGFITNAPCQRAEGTMIYESCAGKKWLIIPTSMRTLRENKNYIAEQIGTALLSGVKINKLSFVFGFLSTDEFDWIKLIVPSLKSAFFDISFICMSLSGAGYEELICSELYDGNGIFDLDMYGKKEEADSLLNGWLRIKGGYPVSHYKR